MEKLNWTCCHCKKIFVFENWRQKGAHTTNCESNPKKAEFLEQRSKLALERKIKSTFNCPKCNSIFELLLTQNEIENKKYSKFCENCIIRRPKYTDEIKNKAIELRKNNKSIKEIAQELGLKKGSISLWTKDIILSEAEKESIKKRTNRGKSNSLFWKKRRVSYQEIGKNRIKENDPLYIAGCMLYWGEGSKATNSLGMTNSDLAMQKLFVNFLRKFWNIKNEKIIFKIQSYTDIHSKEEIIKYWMDGLDLPASSLRKCYWGLKPISSKSVPVKFGKLEYGTCCIQVNDVKIIQEIYGAIQEFGNFSNEKWLIPPHEYQRKPKIKK
jgi:transposase-like protein